jgi:hypothetical protein
MPHLRRDLESRKTLDARLAQQQNTRPYIVSIRDLADRPLSISPTHKPEELPELEYLEKRAPI